jgi:hypothetical protein
MATSEVPNTIRVPVELSHVLAAGKTTTITPKRADVTVAVASAGAAAVSASGTAVTLTCKSDDSTTVTAMLALIAASASVDALLAISGTGTDTFNHLLTRPATPLYMDLTGLLATIFGRTVGGLNVPFLLDDDGQLTIKTTVADAVQSLPYLPATPGATPTVQQGTTGRLNADLSYNIAAGKGIIFHPLQHGVSVSVVSGGAAAVLATGRAVVFTEKSDDTTTLTAMLALLAASNAAGLVAINLGTAVGGDTWNHLLTLADTPLWASGTVLASANLELDEDGYAYPVESEIIPRAIYRAAAARKFAGVDAGAVTVTSAYVLGFTGCNLLGRALYALDLTSGRRHPIVSVVDPAGATAGVITLGTALSATTDTVIVAYASTPPAYNSAADAIQTAAAVADPPAYNGPANPLSSAALVEVAGSYDIDVPIAMYDNATVQVYIDAAAGDTYQIDLLARLDNQAAGDWQNINAVCTTAGTALGAAADPCSLLTSFTTKKLYQELRIRRTKVGANGNAVARIWYKVGR